LGRSLVTFKVFHAAASTPILRSPTSGFFSAVFPLLILGLLERTAVCNARRFKLIIGLGRAAVRHFSNIILRLALVFPVLRR